VYYPSGGYNHLCISLVTAKNGKNAAGLGKLQKSAVVTASLYITKTVTM
jgi:hypothetical protein